MRLIGISGKAGTGKSTLARLLLKCGLISHWVDLADKLKEECAEIFNFPLEWGYSETGKEHIVRHHLLPHGSKRVRQILQWWGDHKRSQNPAYFTNLVKEWMRANEPDSLVIADVRRKDEAQFILDKEGWLLRLEPYDGWKPGPYADHISEIDLDDWQQWHMVMVPEYGKLPTMADMICKVIPKWEQIPGPRVELAEGFDRTISDAVREIE